MIAWIAAANGLDAAATWQAVPGIPEANPLLAPLAETLWLLVVKAAAVALLSAVAVAVSRREGPEARMFDTGLCLASVWYALVLAWHAVGAGWVSRDGPVG